MDLKLRNNSQLSFTASANVYSKITTAYVKDCPNTSGIDLLRNSTNLQRIRCDVGNVSGSVAELLRYTALAGFTDDYQEQQTPRIVGTWTLNNWYTNEELENFQGAIDGLTVLGDGTHNLEQALENGDFAIQTIDSTKPNYNPAAAIIFNNNGYGNIISIPLIEGSGRWFLTKDEAEEITSFPTIFNSKTSVTDVDKIVTDDDEATYNFVTFEELKYFTGCTQLPNSAFTSCTNLEKIYIPENITTLGQYCFRYCSALNEITLPGYLTTIKSYCFPGATADKRINISSIDNWMKNIWPGHNSTYVQYFPSNNRLYINNVEITNIIIPDTITSINASVFYRCVGLTRLINYSNVELASASIAGCASLEYLETYGNFSVGLNEKYQCGTPSGIAIIHGNKTGDGKYVHFGKFIVYGNTTSYWENESTTLKSIRVQGSVTSPSNNYGCMYSRNTSGLPSGNGLEFAEIGSISGSNKLFGQDNLTSGGLSSNCIIHLMENSIAATPTILCASYTRIKKYYVGDGSSRANDEAVLALYLADTDWSAYSAKLATWYDYNGEYKWYYITDNLTNCTNINPDAWPHITRGDSYQTTIVPDEGMTIDSLTVEMLDTDTTSPTYDTMVDITSSVYDSSTGEINIPSVTGNIVITASATSVS